MKEQLERRLEELRGELEAGEKILADLDSRRASLRDSILRISGAIQVLQEEVTRLDDDPGPGQATGGSGRD